MRTRAALPKLIAKEHTAVERAAELRQTAARLRVWSRELREDLVRIQRVTGGSRLTPPPAVEEHPDDRRRLWMSFALALNWVALAILDVERHKLAGLLGWYQSKHGRGITADEAALLGDGNRPVKAAASKPARGRT